MATLMPAPCATPLALSAERLPIAWPAPYALYAADAPASACIRASPLAWLPACALCNAPCARFSAAEVTDTVNPPCLNAVFCVLSLVSCTSVIAMALALAVRSPCNAITSLPVIASVLPATIVTSPSRLPTVLPVWVSVLLVASVLSDCLP